VLFAAVAGAICEAGHMSADVSDLALVQRVQKGDKGAFDLLVLKYQHKVVKLVMRYVRSQADAEDIAQDAFIKAYRALPQFRGDSAFYTWLYRIAINTAKNALASRQRNPVDYELDRVNADGSSDVPYDLQSRMKDTATPEALAMTEEIRATVNAAIQSLPEDLRTAIVLREIDGLSYEEIAAAMDCPVGTVRSRIFRAREAIDAQLQKVFDGGLGRSEGLA
jgi:RNA polymerase sigma-70 factor, ECF subfamily